MNAVIDKGALTRHVRDTALAALPGAQAPKRDGPARAHARCGPMYLSLFVQHSHGKPADGFAFYVNYGIEPIALFEKTVKDTRPTEIASLIRGRFDPVGDLSWFVPAAPDLDALDADLKASVARNWRAEIAPRLSLEGCMGWLKAQEATLAETGRRSKKNAAAQAALLDLMRGQHA